MNDAEPSNAPPATATANDLLADAIAQLPGFDATVLDQAAADAPPVLGTGDLSFRADLEDFVVEEVPLYTPQGTGEHLYLHVEKRGLSTRALVQWLCSKFQLDERDVGYAGQKDERGVTRQWLSVPARRVDPAAVDHPQVQLLASGLHNNKLRLGHLRGNVFTVRIGGDVDEASLRARTSQYARIPNLFGQQRFSHDGRTLIEAARFLRRNRNAQTRREKFWVSAVQSSLFNRWLGDRVADGTWQRALDGDVLQKTENGAPFSCTAADVDDCQARLVAGAVVLAGPLVGRAMRAASGSALTCESRSWQALGIDAEALCALRAFDVDARRIASITPEQVELSPRPDGVTIRFLLPKGSYASVVLRAWLGPRLHDAAFVDGGDT